MQTKKNLFNKPLTQLVPSGLVAYYRLDNDLVDEIGGLDGDALFGSYNIGKFGQGVDTGTFNTGSGFSTPHSDIFQVIDSSDNPLPFSLSMWINFNDVANSNTIYVAGLYSGGDYIFCRIYFSSSSLRYRLCTTNAVNSNFIEKYAAGIRNDFTDGVWYHLVWTYDGSGLSSGMNTYLNGTIYGSQTEVTDGTYAPTYSTNGKTVFGGLNNGAAGARAIMDGIGVWNKELSVSEVLNVYNLQTIGELV